MPKRTAPAVKLAVGEKMAPQYLCLSQKLAASHMQGSGSASKTRTRMLGIDPDIMSNSICATATGQGQEFNYG